jgi:NitT/TauT family transport system substrate-binding protein
MLCPCARGRALVGAAFALLLAVTACAPAPAAAPAARPGNTPAPAAPSGAPAAVAPTAAPMVSGPLSPPVKMKVAVIGIAPEAGIYVALERGYFEQEGIEVELIPVRSAAEQTALLATGELQVGVGGPDPSIFNAVQRDISVNIVGHNAMVTPGDASAALIVRKDLVDSGRYQTLADLKGMKLAINVPGTTSQLYVERILAKGGLTVQDVELTIVPFAEMLTALANRAVDGAWEIEPFVTLGEARDVAKSVIPMAEVYPGAITMVLMLSPVFAKAQPEAARRFVTAHLRGQRDYYRAFVRQEGGKDEIIQILTEHTAVKDAGLYQRMGWHGVDPNGALDERVLDEMQSYFLTNGTQQQRVDLSRVIDRTYVQAAVDRLGRVP